MQIHKHFNAWSSVILAFLLLLSSLALPGSAQAATDSFPILGVLHAGSHPEALAVDTQTHMLYIAYEAPGQVVGFDPISGQVRWHMAIGDVVTDLQADSSTHHLYAVASNDGSRQSSVYILDGLTGHTLATQQSDFGENTIAFDANLHIIYVTNPDAGDIHEYSYLTKGPSNTQLTFLKALHIGRHPQALGVNSRLGRLYVADGEANIISIVDEKSGHTLATLPIGSVPVPPMRVDEATGRIYIVCSLGQELDVIDGHTNTLLAQTPVAPYPEGVAFHTATGRIYIADEGDTDGRGPSPANGTTISVLDGSSFASLGTLEVGRRPDGIEADSALHIVYVALEDNGAVLELSDSLDLPLKSDMSAQRAIAARQTSVWLQQATIITLLLMATTIVGATLRALLPHWRAQGNPQTQPTAASSQRE